MKTFRRRRAGLSATAGLSCYYRTARYCDRKFVLLSPRPFVRLSVTLTYRARIGWVISKIITRIISLGSSLHSSEPQQRRSSYRKHPQISGRIGAGDLSSSSSRLTYLFIRTAQGQIVLTLTYTAYINNTSQTGSNLFIVQIVTLPGDQTLDKYRH